MKVFNKAGDGLFAYWIIVEDVKFVERGNFFQIVQTIGIGRNCVAVALQK